MGAPLWVVPTTMPDRPRLGAVVLAGALESTSLPEIVVEAHLAVPPVYRTVRSMRAPLDLDADVFRYRLNAGGISHLRQRRAARTCREPHRRQP